MKCQKCGKELDENEKFCQGCGLARGASYSEAQKYLHQARTISGMLEILRKAFRAVFSIYVVLMLLSCPIIGGIMVYQITYDGVYAFFGVLVGLIIGLFTVIIWGGLIATFIEIGENTRVIREDIESKRGSQ